MQFFCARVKVDRELDEKGLRRLWTLALGENAASDGYFTVEQETRLFLQVDTRFSTGRAVIVVKVDADGKRHAGGLAKTVAVD